MNHRAEDPVLASSRREALVVFAIWLAACAYSLSWCYAFGYQRDYATLTYILGFPDWVFWGLVVPWTICTLLSFALSCFFITDEDLGKGQTKDILSSLGPLPPELGGGPDHE